MNAPGREIGRPLEPDVPAMRAWLDEAMRRVEGFVTTLDERPATYTGDGAAAAAAMRVDWPDRPVPLDTLLDQIFGRALDEAFNPASPGYMAFVPGGGLFHAALADFIAAVINRYVTVWYAAPGMVQVETDVVRWFCRMIGYPDTALGYLSSGGSMAQFSAVVTARTDRLAPGELARGTLYISDQAHDSLAKAARLAGLPPENVRIVPSDDAFRIDIDRLERAIRDDRERGFAPFFIGASAGTVNTGAVDDLGALADLAGREGLWLHVDAAYGGFFALTERGREILAGIERADSVVLDPHKGLFLPFGTGCLLVRDARALHAAHAFSADYLPPLRDGRLEQVDFCQFSPELSRGFRGLRVWMALRLAGVGAFRDALDEKLDLARLAADGIASIDSVEIVAPPLLSIAAFRLSPPGRSAEELDELNRRWLDAVARRGRVFLTGTRLRGRFTPRIAVLHFRTHRERVEMALEDLRETARSV